MTNIPCTPSSILDKSTFNKANLRNRLSFPISVLKHQSWPQSAALAPKLDIQELVEEEKTRYYSPARFYPARLGEVLNGRYQLATKLGHGSNSTVWLARDRTLGPSKLDHMVANQFL